jgi:hypothetical protein
VESWKYALPQRTGQGMLRDYAQDKNNYLKRPAKFYSLVH